MADPKKNLRIVGADIGDDKIGDVVPAYALAQAHPEILVERKLCAWTDDPTTIVVTTEDLAAAAPDTSATLVKAHSELMADHKVALEQIDSLHAKCLDLEKSNKSLTAELGQKVQDIETYKSQRDKVMLEVEQLKTLVATQPAKT